MLLKHFIPGSLSSSCGICRWRRGIAWNDVIDHSQKSYRFHGFIQKTRRTDAKGRPEFSKWAMNDPLELQEGWISTVESVVSLSVDRFRLNDVIIQFLHSILRIDDAHCERSRIFAKTAMEK
jgi:hypothetical protein